jgi:hypothetical protein
MKSGAEAPVFLVGSGRCGSTIAYSCLAMHPEFAWIPSWLTAAPRFPLVTTANRFWDLPGTDRFRETRFFPKPVEPNAVFERWDDRFADESASPEVLGEARARLVPLIERIRRYHGKNRFLGKMVGRPVKVSVLGAVYSGASFVHVTRDLKPTVCSLLQVDFFRDNVPIDRWPWGVIPSAYLDFFEREGRPPEIAAAITVRLNVQELNRQLSTQPSGRRLELRYADFVRDPIAGVRLIAQAVNFDVSPAYERRLSARRMIAGADRKWMTFFSPEQIQRLDRFEALP